MLIDLGENKTTPTVLDKLEAVVILYPRANQLPPYYLYGDQPPFKCKTSSISQAGSEKIRQWDKKEMQNKNKTNKQKTHKILKKKDERKQIKQVNKQQQKQNQPHFNLCLYLVSAESRRGK